MDTISIDTFINVENETANFLRRVMIKPKKEDTTPNIKSQ